MTASSRSLHQHQHDISMTDLSKLRSIRNAVIGSRTRKSEVVAQGRVPGLVALLKSNSTDDEVKSLAATIIGSLAHAAPPPTLLSLCRAGASAAILQSLEDLSDRISHTLQSSGAAQTLTDPASTLSQQLKLLESFLRALRAILMALADEVAPGTKWERGLSLGVKSSNRSGSSSPRFASIGKSAREVVGWQLANAGFEADGDTQMSHAASSTSLKDSFHLDSVLSPHEELILLARKCIADAFQPTSLRLWLGALFVAKAPIATKGLSASKPGSATQSRASTRPTSPNPAHNNFLSRSSSISMGSDHMSNAIHSKLSSSAPTSSSQVRVLTIVEIVSGILSSCLAVTGGEEGIKSSKTVEPMTASEAIIARRSVVLDFGAADSPYWSAEEVEGGDVTLRGRHVSSGVAGGTLQGSFIKRGKSIDGRGMDEEQQRAAVSQQAEHLLISPHYKADSSVLDALLGAVECGYAKTQEAALWALTDLSRENSDMSRNLFSCPTPSGLLPTSMLLGMRKDPSVSVRLAAFCCLANIIKVHPFTPRTNECVLSVLVELMDSPGEVQVTAIFALARLVADDIELQALACEQYDCIEKLGSLLAKSKAIETGGSASLTNSAGFGMNVLGSISDGLNERLREATLTALAALCFQRDEIRRKTVDLTTPSLLPFVVGSMTAPQVGIRIAACRLVRALSRSISILRTSLVDAGVAVRLLAILQDAKEDGQVRSEAIAAICNLVLKFSPMKQIILEGEGVAKLVEVTKDAKADGSMRLNALFAIKNMLYSSESDLKIQVMTTLGWDYIRQLAVASADVDVQEQALNVIRNVCSTRDEDIEATLSGLGGGEALMDIVEEVIWQRRSENTLVQAAFIVVNLATGKDEHRRLIIERPNLLDALVFFLNHHKPEIRVAGIWAASNLTQPMRVPPHMKSMLATQDVTIEALKRLRSFGFDKRLKELVEDPERDVSDRARGLMIRFESA